MKDECFRPLSGYLISKYYCQNIVNIGKKRFPSPLGVSYFQIHGFHEFNEKYVEWFPSPLGVSYFQILPARARYFTGFSDSFAWQIIFLYIFLISNIHNRLQMQYLCGARQNYLFF